MENKNKELLLKDLCARLPYGVKCQFEDTVRIIDGESSPFYDYVLSARHLDLFINNKNFYVKPYLRPMSSMTKEEIHEFQDILGSEVEVGYGFVDIVNSSIHTFSFLELQALFDWLNKNMFDYRELIPQNLAIEITEENNPYKN